MQTAIIQDRFTRTLCIEEQNLYVESNTRRMLNNDYIWTFATNILCPSVNKTYSGGHGGKFVNSPQATDWKKWANYMIPLTLRGIDKSQIFSNEEEVIAFKLFVFPSVNYDVDNRIKLMHDSFQPNVYRDDMQISIGTEFKVISGYNFDCGLFVCVAPESYAMSIFEELYFRKKTYIPLGKKKKKRLEAMNIRPEYSVKLLNNKIIDSLDMTLSNMEKNLYETEGQTDTEEDFDSDYIPEIFL